MESRKKEALDLADELLADIELQRITPVAIVRKASLLARLMDDTDALAWLAFEVGGYTEKGNGIPPTEWKAAERSGRTYHGKKDGKQVNLATVASLSSLNSTVEVSKIRLQKSTSSENVYERTHIQDQATRSQTVIDKVIGAVYLYVSQVYQELRFGSAVESAFENVRNKVDTSIASLVPDALPMLATALENVQTNDPQQWKNAAKACRDLIKATADALRPAGPDKKGIKMGEGNYVNRLADWIDANLQSQTKADLAKADLAYLGNRLDASSNTGNKGAHADVSKKDASRFIVGTYILLGDILSLSDNPPDVVK